MIAARNYEFLNTGTVDLLVKCNTHLQRQSKKSVVRPCSYCKLLPMFCANASCKPASGAFHKTASIITYRLTFFIDMLFIVGRGYRRMAMVSTLSSISDVGSSGKESSSLSSSLMLSFLT